MPSIEKSAKTKWVKATRHLERADPRIRAIIRLVGPCVIEPRKDYFVALCKAIYSQQLSVRVADVLFGRFREQFPRQRPTPALVLGLLDGDPEKVRRCGLSRQKMGYLRDLATHFVEGRIQTRRLASMSDEQIIEALASVKGIGKWTAEMFLMFVLNRPDVLPVDDLGLREAVKQVYGLKDRPTAAELNTIGEPWRPYRTVASWYLWRGGATKKVVAETTGNQTGRKKSKVKSE